MKMNIPEPARKIIDRLNEHGYEAYVVGGCVRDMILKREPGDWDITTSARPEQVKALFTRTLDTGIQHGTVTIMVGKEGYEVTTFRVDGDYTDGRHPDTVTFTPSLEEDLKRRDFTINAMAYNHNTGLVDIFGGREDIDRKVIQRNVLQKMPCVSCGLSVFLPSWDLRSKMPHGRRSQKSLQI